MSVAGYFPWVRWNATLPALTGKAYRIGRLVFALALGFAVVGTALADGGVAEGVGGGDGGAETAVDGATNCGVAAADGPPPAPPQPARHSASTVRPERVRTATTGPSWQKPLIRADSPGLDSLHTYACCRFVLEECPWLSDRCTGPRPNHRRPAGCRHRATR
jgi:hypothetical protein